MATVRFRICHLYPDLMGIYGDRGNLIALRERARWHGLEVEVEDVGLGPTPDFSAFDVILIGGGQDREQRIISTDLQQHKGPALAAAIEDGCAVLAICGGYQLLGRYYKTGSGEILPGLGLLDAWTEAGQRRMIGNAVIESDLCGRARTIVGFENHSGQTFLGPNARPLGRVKKGSGNNGRDGNEGAVYKATIGTYLHGSVLPKNPHLADWLLQRALARRHPDIELRTLDDTLEEQAHAAAVRRALG